MKFLIVFFLIINIISCGDDGPNCPGDMSLSIEISPYKPYYNIGDTITISSKFYKLIYDKKTDKFYNASTYNFAPIISLTSLDNAETNRLGSQVVQYSDFIKNKDSNMNIIYAGVENAIAGDYRVESDSLNFQINLKLNKAGYFRLEIESLSTGDGHLQNNYHFGCRGRQITFYLMSPKESNIHLMQNLRSIYPNDYILSDSIHRFYNRAGYCFEVR